MDKFAELKTEYCHFLDFLKEKDPEATDESFSTYFIASVLKIWGSNLLYSMDYASLLSSLSGENYTIEQVVTAMGCCGDPERKILVPDFFKRIVDLDKLSASRHSSQFIEKLNDLLVGSAMINGDFTTEEATCVSAITESLVDYAANNGVTISPAPDNMAKITEKNENSYLQNEALLEAARKKKSQKESESHMDSSTNSTAPMTININLVANEESAVAKDDTQSVAPEEASVVATPVTNESETMESLLAELDGLVGLKNVKQDIHSLMNFIKVTKIREQRGMKVPTISYHLVFTGNPGTGKTTVARLVAKLYYHMGILPRGQLVETDRSALVAGYLGQTAIKTQKVIQQAMGGVLFIDEAYSLAGDTDDSYGREAIDTILKAMEDHRDELVVIVAGYTELMHKFIKSNPGLSSRFSKYFEYPDYSGEELLAIFNRLCEKSGYKLDSNAAERLMTKFNELYENRDEHFGNARTARNIFEKAINAQADRIAKQSSFSDSDLEIITSDDIIIAIGGLA